MFLDDDKKKYISQLIKKTILTNLNEYDCDFLLDHLFKLINFVYNRFSINNMIDFWNQLTDNNNKDIIALFNLLLPYINDNEGSYTLHKQIRLLSDISMKKNSKITTPTENPYIISNIQYNLYSDKEEIYDKNMFLSNFNLLLQTIEQISNKLYVNWLNILPITLTSFKKSNLYLNSPKYHNQRFILKDGTDIIKLITNANNDYTGISIGDIFNTIYYDLYYDIKKIKWLIYQDCFDRPNVDQLYIEIFNNIIVIPGLYDNLLWNELDIEQQNKFIYNFNNLYKLIQENSTKKRNSYLNLLLSINLFFERYYNKVNSLVNNVSYIIISEEENFKNSDNDEIEKSYTEEVQTFIIENFKKIPYNDLYDYLLETIQQFIHTWYGRHICYFNSETKEFNFNYSSYINTPLSKNVDIKYKFFYNFAKTIVTIYTKNNLYFRNHWFALSFAEKEEIINLLSGTYATVKKYASPMSFTKYYIRTYGEKYTEQNGLDDISFANEIYEQIKMHLIDIVFETHIVKGLLTEFVINPYITSKLYLGNKQINRKKNMKQYIFTKEKVNDYNQNAFYYLTNQTYGQIPFINRSGKQSYFDHLVNNQNWYTFYSMNWVTQISFFHHYINNRVIMVTGATGQGKSTQVPKLFLYGLKMIDRNTSGRIICSQPRIASTKDVSDQISYELGLPIKEYSIPNKTYIKTFNPYIQYQTQKDSHIVEQYNGLMLKFVTDKLLYMALLQSPFFKSIQKSHNNISQFVENNIYRKENMYDIIIIDESHEHNVNMDLILTIAKSTIQYNNMLKLVIVSATMISDEPIYRRYYKTIDDNFSYPFNAYNAKFGLDRNYIDRRFDITPPSETTQYNIYEYYLNDEPQKPDDAIELSKNKILDLLNNSTGNILLFSITANDINEICDFINNNTLKSHYIAIPFYSKMPVRLNIFNKLSSELLNITIDKRDFINYHINKTVTHPRHVPTGTYTNAVIVATNIAEASITIPNLKYVVDIGYYISITYNPNTNNSISEIKKISELSRIQRKGRVGRVSDGYVYYMYTLNSRLKIKPEYKICNENIQYDLYELCSSNINEQFILPHFNWLSIIYKNINLYFDKFKQDYAYYMKNKLFNNLIVSQYTYKGHILPSIINISSNITYDNINIIKNTDFSFDILKTFFRYDSNNFRLLSGYNINKTIMDPTCTFYIIHPDEVQLKRNLLSGVRKTNYFSQRIFTLLKNCYYQNMFIYQTKLMTFTTSFLQNLYFEKTIFGRFIQNILNNIDINDDSIMNRSLVLTLLYAYVCDNMEIRSNSSYFDTVLMMIILMEMTNYQSDNFNNIIKHITYKNDLDIYYSLAKTILSIINFDNDFDYTQLFEHDKQIILSNKQTIIRELKQGSSNYNINIDIYNKLIDLVNRNKLNIRNNIDDYIESSSIKLSSKQLNIISAFLKINIFTIKTGFDKFMKIKASYNKLINKHNVQFTTNELLWFKNNLPINKSTDPFINISKAFIYGFNYMKTIINYQANFYNINSLEKIKKIINSKTPLTESMIYLHSDKDHLYLLINTDEKTLIECNPLYWFSIMAELTKKIPTDLIKYIRSRFVNAKYINYMLLKQYTTKSPLNDFVVSVIRQQPI